MSINRPRHDGQSIIQIYTFPSMPIIEEELNGGAAASNRRKDFSRIHSSMLVIYCKCRIVTFFAARATVENAARIINNSMGYWA